MISIILCGGSGTRLWPLSRKNYPKQFLRLIGDKSLLQDTFLRTANIVNSDKIFIIGNGENSNNIYDQIREIYPDFNKKNIVIEPVSLNTAPAIALAVKYLLSDFNIDINEQILVLPADHYISNPDTYYSLINKVKDSSLDNIFTIGIKPNRADTGYGYLKRGEEVGDAFKVLEFKEKPDLETAEKYFNSSLYLWNSGMYIFSSKVFIDECKKYCPEIYSLMQDSHDNFILNFKSLPKISIDYAISEKSDKVLVVLGDFEWNDVGSFDRLSDVIGSDQVSIDSNNIFSYSKNKKLIVALGVDDLNIIENDNIILVCKKGSDDDMKKITEYLKNNDLKELL